MQGKFRYFGYHFAALVLLLSSCSLVYAQPSGSLPSVYDGVSLTQRQGEQIPLDLAFRNAAGEEVQLGTYFNQGRPVILTLGYYNCPQLCNIILKGLTDALQQMKWKPGQEFDIVSVSFDATETPEQAAALKAQYLAALGVPEADAGWYFLTGEEETAIRPLAAAIGFNYRWVEDIQQYVHPAVLTFLGETGTVSQYMQGLSFRPQDIRLSLVEASNGSVGNAIDMIALYCLQYDPEANSYVVQAANVMRLGGAITVVFLAVTLFLFWRRERFRAGRLAQT